MNRGKTSVLMGCFLLGVVFGFAGAIPLFLAIQPIREVEISPSEPANVLEFYVALLREHSYTVTEQELRVNEYEKVTFKEFLWLLQEGNYSECFVDYGFIDILGMKIRTPKLWIQIDGIY